MTVGGIFPNINATILYIKTPSDEKDRVVLHVINHTNIDKTAIRIVVNARENIPAGRSVGLPPATCTKLVVALEEAFEVVDGVVEDVEGGVELGAEVENSVETGMLVAVDCWLFVTTFALVLRAVETSLCAVLLEETITGWAFCCWQKVKNCWNVGTT